MEPPGAVEGRRLRTIPSTSSKSIHHESLYRHRESVSHDNLQLRAIFDRLEAINLDPHPQSSSQTLHASSSLSAKLNTRCACGNIESSSLRGQRYRNGTGTASSDSETDSDDGDTDDEPFSLVALIGMLVAQERKGTARQHGAIKNLAASCRGDMISDSHLHQLVHLTSSSNQQVRQATFLALRQASMDEVNTKILLQMGVVPQLLTLLQDKMEASNHAIAAAVLEKIVMHKKLADHWLEKMITRGLSVLIGCLSSANQAPETKVAVGCLLSSLACYFEIAVLLLDHCMEDMMEMWLRYPIMKESLTDLFSHIAQHTDHTVAGVLEHRVLEHVREALRDESCHVQIKAAGFFLALCGSSYGLSALLDDGKVRVILRVLRSTHCRRLRELCMATLTKILQHATHNQLKDMILQTESAFCDDSSAMEWKDPGVKSLKDEPGYLGSRTKDVSARTEKGIRTFINVLIETIHKEAKIAVDQNKRIKTVGFRPCLDCFKTLLDTVRCLCYTATTAVGRQRNRTSSHNTRVSVEGSKNKAHKLNTDVLQFMFYQGALCVLDLLNTYTHHIFPLTGEQQSLQPQRNLDVLHLQAMMKVWQVVSPPSQDNPLPGEEELQFVQQLVECVRLFARCSSELWNNKVETEVKSKIEEHQSWKGEPDSVEHTATRHYRYVKTVDQAFPSSLKIENITSHRQEEMEIRERQANSIQQRRMAWGDKKGQGVEVLSNHQSSPSGDSPKTTKLKKTRPISAKKQDLGPNKFDLSKSVFTEQAKLVSSTKHREPARVKRNVRTAGYAGRTAAIAKRDGQQESEIGVAERELHRKLRTRLFQEGICQTVGPWVACQVPQIQTLAAECLRCVIQPLHPEEARHLRESAEAKERRNRHKTRSEMAKTLAERDRILSQVLGRMSTGSADVVRDALGVKGQSEEELTKTSKGSKLKSKLPSNAARHKPTCNSDEPIGWQCSIHLLEVCGSQILKGLRTESSEVKRACLLFLYDLVVFGETVVHMKLASLGGVSQLMDFLRKNCQTQSIALIGVMTLRNLVSDCRLKQIFCSEGGEAFLNDLIKTSEGALQMTLHQFLKHITEGPGGIL